MIDPHSFERLRPLGRLERHASARHSLDFYNNVATSASYYNPSFTGALQHIVYGALAKVVAQQPILSAIVVDEDTNAPFFARLPKIDLKDAVTFVTREQSYDESASDDTGLDQVLQEQHNRNFKERLGEVPFWRVVILCDENDAQDFAVCFVYHHAIGDGQSGFAFHRAFQEALSAVSDSAAAGKTDESETIITSPDTALLPPLEGLGEFPLSTFFLLKALWNDWFPKPTEGLWVGLPITDSQTKRKTCFRSFSLSKKDTAKLRTDARENGTTLTALAQTMLATSAFVHLPEQYTALRGSGPISMRRYLSSYLVDKDSMGDFVGQYIETHHRPQASSTDASGRLKASDLFSWEEAQRVKRTIAAEVNMEGKNSGIALLEYVKDLHQFFLKKVGKARSDSFEFSNVGVFQPCASDHRASVIPWKVGKVCFSQCANVVGDAFECSVATGGDGRMTMAFTWLEGIVESDWMHKVIDEFEVALRELAWPREARSDGKRRSIGNGEA